MHRTLPRTSPFLCALVLLASLLASGGLQAQPLTWDYGSLSLLFSGHADLDGRESIDRGFRFDAAQSLNDGVFVRARADTHSFDDRGIDTLQWGLGGKVDLVGTTHPIHIWGSLQYERANLGGGAADGLGIDLGLRASISADFEAGLTYKIAELSGAESIDHEAFEFHLAYTGIERVDILGTLNNARFRNSGELDLNNIVGIGLRVHMH